MSYWLLLQVLEQRLVPQFRIPSKTRARKSSSCPSNPEDSWSYSSSFWLDSPWTRLTSVKRMKLVICWLTAKTRHLSNRTPVRRVAKKKVSRRLVQITIKNTTSSPKSRKSSAKKTHLHRSHHNIRLRRKMFWDNRITSWVSTIILKMLSFHNRLKILRCQFRKSLQRIWMTQWSSPKSHLSKIT